MPTAAPFGFWSSSDQVGTLATARAKKRDRPVLSGNTVIVDVSQDGGGGAPTVTDDQGNTYTKLVDVTRGNRLTIWVAENVTNGPTIFSASFAGGGSAYVSVVVHEVCGIGTWVSGGSLLTTNTGTSTTPNAGSFTPSAGGYVHCAMVVDDSATYLTSMAPAAGYTQAISDFNETFFGVNWKIHTSGATTPGFTINASRGWTCGALSFPADVSKGTARSLICIDSMQNTVFPTSGSPSGSYKIPLPSIGADTIAFQTEANPGVTITSITDSSSNTWVQAGSGVSNGAGGGIQVFYCNRPTTSNTLVLTVNFTGTNDDTFISVYRLKGTAPLAQVDAPTSGTGNNTTTTTQAGTAFTPPTTDGLLLRVLGVESNTVTAVNVGVFISDTSTPVKSSPDELMENNGYSAEYPTSLSPTTATWTTNAAPGHWEDYNVFFRAALVVIDVSMMQDTRTHEELLESDELVAY